MVTLPFANRTEAGRLLATELVRRKLSGKVIVLALPRGGLPVALEVATALNAPLDVVIVRKLGVPWQPELAMGAIASGPFQSLDEALIQALGISREEVDAVAVRERAVVARREKLYRGDRPALDLHGRTVVLVDDGLATGSTMLVATRYVHSFRPAKTIIAVPVASVEACERLRPAADELICLAKPQPFTAVGEWYTDFQQVTDEEAQNCLNRAHASRSASQQ